MKKYLSLLLFILLTLSCGKSGETLKIYMWTDNIPQDVYEDFTKETGIKIIEDAISSNEEIYAKVKSSSGVYDIVTPSLDYAEIMMSEGLVDAYDPMMIPNLKNIDSDVLDRIKKIDTNMQYIIPFAYGPTVIAYDTTRISNNIRGFEIFSNPSYKGNMLLLNDMREVMGSALILLGYHIDETNEKAMKEVESLLRVWKSNILRFDSDSFHLAYANGDVDVVHGYPDTIVPSLSPEKLKNTKFIVPDKGAMMWIDNFLILKNAPNKEAAQKFINFIHRPDIYARIMDYVNSLSLNVPARELMTVKSYVSYDDLDRASNLEAIPDDVLTIHSRVWENLQAQ